MTIIRVTGELMRKPCLMFCGYAIVLWYGTAALHAQQNPDGQIPLAGVKDAYLFLIRDPLVQRELQMSQQQQQAITGVTDELDVTLWTLRNQPADRAEPGLRDLTAKAEAQMASILSAAQQQRLAQIRLSVTGFQALLRDDIAAQLNLSRDQRLQIEQVLQESQQRTRPDSSARSRQRRGRESGHAARRYRGNSYHRDSHARNVPQAATAGPTAGWLQAGIRQVPRSRATRTRRLAELEAAHHVSTARSGRRTALLDLWMNQLHSQFPLVQGLAQYVCERGVTLIGIHTPETADEHDVQRVQERRRSSSSSSPS